jgi:hypothetical protein
MIRITDLVGALSHYLERQRRLAECRQRATGDVEYYAYVYIQEFRVAEMELERALNTYIDQRVAEKLGALNPQSA